jgi:hypothetical protein
VENFNFPAYDTKEEIQQAIGNISYPTSQPTDTPAGLNLSLTAVCCAGHILDNGLHSVLVLRRVPKDDSKVTAAPFAHIKANIYIYIYIIHALLLKTVLRATNAIAMCFFHNSESIFRGLASGLLIPRRPQCM